jgi:hypothetical protein
MTRESTVKFCREELDKHGLSDWHIRIHPKMDVLGLCSYKDKCIILSSHHLDIHPDPEILNTIRHEIAHALTPGHGHDSVWEECAKRIGCTSIARVSHLSYPDHVIDAIRSGATVEVTFETEVIHRPKYQITRLQDKCEFCGKVAKLKREVLIESKDDVTPDRKLLFLECGHLIVKHIPKGTPFQTLVSNHWKDEVKECKHEWVHNQCIHCKEYKLFPFQVEGARFTEAALSVNKGDGIFDEMGLGKTIQSLAYLKFHEEKTPVLFIVKSKSKFQWFKEILRWCGPSYLPQIIQTSTDFLIPNLKCYIISHDMLVAKERKGKNGKTIKQGFDGARFKELGIKTIVVDECQLIKNPDASRTQEVRKLCKDAQVIALSGTPWKNRGSEFFTILNILAPTKFPSYQQFIDRWVDTYWDGKHVKQGGIRRVEEFREYTKDIVIRREVSEVMKEMPEVNPTLFFTELNKWEQSEYDDAETDFVKWYIDAEANDELGKFGGEGNILAKLAKMRHLVALAKIPATVEFVNQFVEETEQKITVFTHHKDVHALLVDELKKSNPNIPVFSLVSELSPLRAFQIAEEFNKTEVCILVASTMAFGEAINLQTCGTAILHERQWNPQNEEQAAPGRFRRIGSTFKVVNVTYMTAGGTVDEILADIVSKKRAFFHNSMNKTEMQVWNEAEFAKELAQGIVRQFQSKKRNKK